MFSGCPSHSLSLSFIHIIIFFNFNFAYSLLWTNIYSNALYKVVYTIPGTQDITYTTYSISKQDMYIHITFIHLTSTSYPNPQMNLLKTREENITCHPIGYLIFSAFWNTHSSAENWLFALQVIDPWISFHTLGVVRATPHTLIRRIWIRLMNFL